MAIYTRFGGEVEIIEARMIPVWVVRLPAEIKWFYRKPTRRYKNVKECRSGIIAGGTPTAATQWLAANGATPAS